MANIPMSSPVKTPLSLSPSPSVSHYTEENKNNFSSNKSSSGSKASLLFTESKVRSYTEGGEEEESSEVLIVKSPSRPSSKQSSHLSRNNSTHLKNDLSRSSIESIKSRSSNFESNINDDDVPKFIVHSKTFCFINLHKNYRTYTF
jgi:hypothetical protein